MVKDHAINRGMKEFRLFVKFAITNRQTRLKGIRYHAKMKRGLMKRDWSSLRITLEEKPIKDFFKLIVGGKCPPSLTLEWKKKMQPMKGQSNLYKKFQFLLTSRGKQ